MRTETHLHWGPRRGDEACVKETTGPCSGAQHETRMKWNPMSQFFLLKRRLKPEVLSKEVIYDIANHRNIWMSPEHSAWKAGMLQPWVWNRHKMNQSANEWDCLPPPTLLGPKESRSQAWGYGAWDEDVYERQTTQTSTGSAVSEISVFPAVALSAINP